MYRQKVKNTRSLARMALAVFLFSVSCSTTRVLEEGEFRLSDNTVEITNDKDFDEAEITPYIKQQPNMKFIFGWNPLLNIYNLSGKDPDKWINKIIRGFGQAPVVYKPELVESSVENIRNHLEYIGYYGSKVHSDVSVNRRTINVKYEVTLGKRFRISNIQYILPKTGEFPADFLSDTSNVTVKRGTWLSESILEKESERSAAAMREKGYYGFTKNYYFFQADTLSNPGLASVDIEIRDYTRNESQDNAVPHRKFKYGNVSISHDKDLKFNGKVLRDMNLIVPGDTYAEKTVNNTYSRFSALNVFNSVNVEMTQADTNVVDCSINLSQSRYQGFKTNLEVSSNSSGLIGISPQISYFHKNIFHGGEWLTLSFLGNFQFKTSDDIHSNELGVSAGLSIPRVLGFNFLLPKGPNVPRTEINASYNFQNRPEYTRNIISTSFGYTGSFGSDTFCQIYPLQLKIVRLYNMEPDFYSRLENNPFMRDAYQNHFDIGSGLSLYRSTDFSVVPKSSYHYSRLQFDASGNLLSLFNRYMKQDIYGSRLIWGTPYSQYIRAEFSLGKTWVFGPDNRQGLATRFLMGMGYAYGNSTTLPFEKQFYSGGANSLRGWQARAVGPGSSPLNEFFSIPSQTGDMKLEANVEYRFPMFWKIAGALFVDAGNVWTLRDDMNDQKSQFRFDRLGDTIAMDWGLGVRLDLSFLLLRVDMGIKLHDPSREGTYLIPVEDWLGKDGFALHFGVGYPF